MILGGYQCRMIIQVLTILLFRYSVIDASHNSAVI